MELMLGVKPVIVEGNCHRGEGVKKHQKLDKLFGDNIWDITILVFYPPKERVREQLLYLLLQFKPARCPLRLIFCGPLPGVGFLRLSGHKRSSGERELCPYGWRFSYGRQRCPN